MNDSQTINNRSCRERITALLYGGRLVRGIEDNPLPLTRVGDEKSVSRNHTYDLSVQTVQSCSEVLHDLLRRSFALTEHSVEFSNSHITAYFAERCNGKVTNDGLRLRFVINESLQSDQHAAPSFTWFTPENTKMTPRRHLSNSAHFALRDLRSMTEEQETDCIQHISRVISSVSNMPWHDSRISQVAQQWEDESGNWGFCSTVGQSARIDPKGPDGDSGLIWQLDIGIRQGGAH